MQKQNGIVQQRGSWQLQTADRNGRWTYLLFFKQDTSFSARPADRLFLSSGNEINTD